MDLEEKLATLIKVVREHREVLLTEEAAKTALVMPFLQALGYDVFNPAEVIPEFTADFGTKKGEKVDYALVVGGRLAVLIECKPASVALEIKHAAQLHRYFSVTEARLAILTNGVVYRFYGDVEAANKMDTQPFFEVSLEALRPSDLKTLRSFARGAFDAGQIAAEARTLKSASLVKREVAKELASPSDELVRLIAARVSDRNLTAAVRESYRPLVVDALAGFIRDRVDERLRTALAAANPLEERSDEAPPTGAIVTTEDEIAGFNIVRAIGSRLVDPKRITIRDAETYCAILLDDNNRKPIVRLRFNSPTTRYLGTFDGKAETRHRIDQPTDIFQHEDAIRGRIEQMLG